MIIKEVGISRLRAIGKIWFHFPVDYSIHQYVESFWFIFHMTAVNRRPKLKWVTAPLVI